MHPFYLAAVIGTRLITVVCLLILSHQMAADEFGIFTLVITNALALQMAFGSWLSSLATRLLVHDTAAPELKTLSAIATAAALVIGLYLLAAFGVTIAGVGPASHVLGTAGLAASLLVYEITLAILNAAGIELKYAAFALTRNVSALIGSICLVWIGFRANGAIIGQIAASWVAICCTPSAFRTWRSARLSFGALLVFRSQVRLALAGSITLGIYIIVNAPVRNLVTHKLGFEVAGVWSLSGDIFYGPLNLLASAYILSKLRVMYIDEREGNEGALIVHARQLMNFALGLALPYLIGGMLFAPAIARVVLPLSLRSSGALLAPYSVAQGSLILILYCLATIALVHRRLGQLVTVAISTAIFPSLCLFLWGDTTAHAAVATVAGLAVAVAGAAALSVADGLFRPDWTELGKLALASSGLWLASALCRAVFAFPGSEVAAALVGTGVFVATAAWLRLAALFELVPPWLWRRTAAGEPRSLAE